MIVRVNKTIKNDQGTAKEIKMRNKESTLCQVYKPHLKIILLRYYPFWLWATAFQEFRM